MFTLSNCIEKINQALNYTSIAYSDIELYLDQAIAELNTSLHISIDPISILCRENRFKPAQNVVILTSEPTAATRVPITDHPVDELYCFSPAKQMFAKKIAGEYMWFKNLEAVYQDPNSANPKFYTAFVFSEDAVLWAASNVYDMLEFELTNILPYNWIILFLIPYVCFKQAVKDGDTGALFSEEFSQGFQQLRTSYHIPEKVILSRVAHLPAYNNLISEHLPNLNIYVPTKAITEDMQVEKGIRAIYGSMYDRGGWDL